MKGTIVLVAGIVLLHCAITQAGSIFDPTPDSDSSAPSPAAPAPAPRPAPQAAPAPKPDPVPAPEPAPAESTPAPAPAPDQAVSDLDALGATARASIIAAHKAVDDYRKAAEAKCAAQVETTGRYQSALAESSAAEKNLEDARVLGDSSAKIQASAAAAKAKARLKQLVEIAMANNESVQEAKRLATAFAAQTTTKILDKATPSQDDEITKAIHDRRLMEGMTLDQAARAARSRPELVTQRDGMAEYVWRIMGTVRYTNHTWRDAFGHLRSDRVPVQGEVAEVQASFADGKLVTFQRVDKPGL